MRIEVICTGDEVLTGKVVNTNFSYISQKLEDFGLTLSWETTVGDDRESLLLAFQLAAKRADAVIVNGGLGPTIDDLSQEIAAKAAQVELVLSADWLGRMEAYFQRRGRVMSANNRKQAMLPAGAEIIDNPIGTACGFALDIGRTRFYFTPGVPRELHRMLDEQIIPRLVAASGSPTAVYLKRFHSYGIGESHADALLEGVEALAPPGSVKLGFRTHYPQIETKLTARGTDRESLVAMAAPVVQEVRRRLGNFIVAEDDSTLEGNIVAALASERATLAIAETFTGGQIASRIMSVQRGALVVRRGIVAPDLGELGRAVGVGEELAGGEISREMVETIARGLQTRSSATHALAVVIDLAEGDEGGDCSATVYTAIASDRDVVSRRSRIVGIHDWVRRGATEMGLDCLRRYLQGVPIYERVDFEQAR